MNTEGTPLSAWLTLLMDGIVPSDMPIGVVRAFFHHLADLGLFVSSGGDLWSMPEQTFEEPTRDMIARQLNVIVKKEPNIIPYFILSDKDLPDLFSFKEKCLASPSEVDTLQGIKSSDLSNLQIVKKVGRQLEPFIELEKSFLNHVTGPHTSPEEARILFNYALERTREKVKPRPWEQLSRRRHK